MRTILATIALAITSSPSECRRLRPLRPPSTSASRAETETLFEGPVLTDGHNVRASSDAKAPAAGRRCNGLNNNQNPLPGPTPTAASVDAMRILGLDFDGQWYAEPFEDYFIKRWGPDAQDEGEGEYWGVVVNNVFTSVGGCQYQLDDGDEVLWVYDAFDGRPRLALYPADYSGGAVPLTASVELGQPFEVEVEAWGDYNEGAPPASPQRTGAESFEGAEVAPVVTGAGGFEAIDSDDPLTVSPTRTVWRRSSSRRWGGTGSRPLIVGPGARRPRSAPTASTSASTSRPRANARRCRRTTCQVRTPPPAGGAGRRSRPPATAGRAVPRPRPRPPRQSLPPRAPTRSGCSLRGSIAAASPRAWSR